MLALAVTHLNINIELYCKMLNCACTPGLWDLVVTIQRSKLAHSDRYAHLPLPSRKQNIHIFHSSYGDE